MATRCARPVTPMRAQAWLTGCSGDRGCLIFLTARSGHVGVWLPPRGRSKTVTDKVWTVDDLSVAFPHKRKREVESGNYSTFREARWCVKRREREPYYPEIPTAVRLKVARKASPRMDRSKHFQRALPPLYAPTCHRTIWKYLMRQHPGGCAGKSLRNSDRLRQEIERSYRRRERRPTVLHGGGRSGRGRRCAA